MVCTWTEHPRWKAVLGRNQFGRRQFHLEFFSRCCSQHTPRGMQKDCYRSPDVVASISWAPVRQTASEAKPRFFVTSGKDVQRDSPARSIRRQLSRTSRGADGGGRPSRDRESRFVIQRKSLFDVKGKLTSTPYVAYTGSTAVASCSTFADPAPPVTYCLRVHACNCEYITHA